MPGLTATRIVAAKIPKPRRAIRSANRLSLGRRMGYRSDRCKRVPGIGA